MTQHVVDVVNSYDYPIQLMNGLCKISTKVDWYREINKAIQDNEIKVVKFEKGDFVHTIFCSNKLNIQIM